MASIARALLRLEVAWTAFATGYFRIGISTLGGTDTLGVAQTDPRFSGTLDDISRAVRSATWGRGRSEDFTQMEGGTAAFTLRDADGTYNPENPASVLYGLLGERLHPIRWRASLDGGATWHGLFAGWVKSIEPQVGVRKSLVTFNCVDLFHWLRRAKPVLANAGPCWTGDAIGRVLDACGLYDPSGRDLDRGDWLLNGFSADGSADGLALVQGLLEAERGVFYADGDGRARYDDRHAKMLRTSAATISGIMRAISPGADADRVTNVVTVTVTDADGAELASVQSTNEESRRRFGDAELGAITTPYLLPADAGQLGSYLLGRTGITRGALRGLEIDAREAALLTQIVTRELEEVITADEAVAGTTGDYDIERLQGTYDSTGGGLLSASYGLSRHVALGNALVLGAGQIGVAELVY